MRSRAARFLKFSKSAVVRSSRSQFSSARFARVLSCSICSSVSGTTATGSAPAVSGAAGAGGGACLSFISSCSFFFMRLFVLRNPARGVKLDDLAASGNPDERRQCPNLIVGHDVRSATRYLVACKSGHYRIGGHFGGTIFWNSGRLRKASKRGSERLVAARLLALGFCWSRLAFKFMAIRKLSSASLFFPITALSAARS